MNTPQNAIPQASVHHDGEADAEGKLIPKPVQSPLLPDSSLAAEQLASPLGAAEVQHVQLPEMPDVTDLTPEQLAAKHKIESGQYVDMLRENIPTLRAELRAAEFLLAELTHAGDVQTKKKMFLKSASKTTGGLPPLTEVAMRLIAKKPRK